MIILINVGVLSLFIFLIFTLNRLKKESILILMVFVLVGWMLVDKLPTIDETLEGGRFILVFAALIPTMTIVKETAMTMIPVKKSQELLTELPADTSFLGLQLVAHTFGSVINTGRYPFCCAPSRQ